MSLANPAGLLGLLALPVILGLHLLRARRLRYTVSSLSLWSFLEEEVRGAVPRRIPPGWLLALDLLAALLFSLAWSQPQIPRPVLVQPARRLVLVLDISTSMNARGAGSTRFEQARAALLAQLRGLRGRDTAAVIVFSRYPRLVGDTCQLNLEELVARVNRLEAGGVGSDVALALASAAALAQAGQPLEIHVFTDGAYPASGLDLPAAVWHVFNASSENQAVLALAAAPTGANETGVFTRVVNFGARPVRRTAVLLLDGQEYDRAALELDPGAGQTRAWRISGRPGIVVLRLEGQDALPDDDQAVAVLPASSAVRVALIANQPAPLDRALRAVPGVRLSVFAPAEYQPGLDYDLTVFRDALPGAWPAGQVLVFDPPQDSPLLPVEGGQVVSSQAVYTPFTGVDHEVAAGALDFSGVVWGATARLLETPAGFLTVAQAGGQPLLVHGRSGQASIDVLLADLDGGNLTRHPLLPVLVASAVERARSDGWPSALLAGQAVALPPAGRYAGLSIQSPQGETVRWGMETPLEWLPDGGPGVYRVEAVTQTGEKREAAFGVNAGSPLESDLRQQVRGDEAGQAQEAQQHVEERPLDLAPWLLGVGLLALLVEAWLAWR